MKAFTFYIPLMHCTRTVSANRKCSAKRAIVRQFGLSEKDSLNLIGVNL